MNWLQPRLTLIVVWIVVMLGVCGLFFVPKSPDPNEVATIEAIRDVIRLSYTIGCSDRVAASAAPDKDNAADGADQCRTEADRFVRSITRDAARTVAGAGGPLAAPGQGTTP